MPLTSADFRIQVRHLIRDTAGLGDTPNPSLFIFTDDEIDEYVQDGVTEYTRYRKRRLPYTLTLQPGKTEYDLPDDWITVDQESFDKAVSPPDEIDFYSFAGFVLPTLNPGEPLWNMQFDFYDGERFVQVNPAPQGTSTMNFAYFATHTVNAETCTIPTQDVRFVSVVAASYALNALAVDRGLKMQKYKVGNGIMIDDSEVAKRLQEQADRYMAEFTRRVVNQAIGVVG